MRNRAASEAELSHSAAELSDFVARASKKQHPDRARHEASCGWLEGRSLAGVRFAKQVSEWDHLDDGSATAHIELSFACSDDVHATTRIELRMGPPPSDVCRARPGRCACAHSMQSWRNISVHDWCPPLITRLHLPVNRAI